MTEPALVGEKKYMCPRRAEVSFGALHLCTQHANDLTELTTRRGRHNKAFTTALVREHDSVIEMRDNLEVEIAERVEQEIQNDARWLDIQERSARRGPIKTHQHDPLTYYVRRDELIKIGTTAFLPGRLRALNGGINVPVQATVTLLATEPGSEAVEHARHRQFAQCRVAGEWFKASAELLEHISRLPGREIDAEVRSLGLAQ